MSKTRQKRQRNRRWVGVVFFVLLVAGAAFVVFAVARELGGDAAQNGREQGVEVGGEQLPSSQDADGGDTAGSSLPTTEQDKDIHRDEPSSGTDLAVWATLSRVSGDTLLIRIQIDQNISEGTCELKIGDYVETASVAAQPQSASCAGFDVPTSVYSGDEFSVLVKSGDKSGSVTGKIDG